MMLEALGLFVLGLLLLALGGDSLVKGASGLAARAGASPFVTGLVLVAFGTSLPEIAVNLHAMARGEPDLALGNAIGSNVVNFGLTLGAAAMATPLLVRWRALNPLLLVLVMGTVAAIVFGLDGSLSRIEGGVLLLGFVATLAFAFARGRHEVPELQEELNIDSSQYEGPTGIVGVLSHMASLGGFPTVSLWAAVPHYVAQSPSPKAELALLRELEELLSVTLPLDVIAEDAEAWERGVNELAADDPEIAAYVQQLEEAKDTTDLPEATGDAIAKEFERYLRRRRDDK